jgi:hypothetical protein
MGNGKLIHFLRLIPLIALLAAPAWGQNAPTRESQVKAAMLCNFVLFVDWPSDAFASADSPLVIGVMNPNPFGDILEQLSHGKTVNGRSIVIQHYDSADEITRCQALFIPAARNADLNAIMHKIGDQPVLSVGESDAFPWAGGVLRFYLEDNKIRFQVSPDAAARARLQISSKLMKLATIFKR